MPGIALEIRRKCKICGKVFLVKKLDSQYCSGKCSKIAYKRKCDAEKKEERLAKMASQVPNIREYISVKEAVAIFGVERDSVYRLVRSWKISRIWSAGNCKKLTPILAQGADPYFLIKK